jgi:hypothetical protein
MEAEGNEGRRRGSHEQRLSNTPVGHGSRLLGLCLLLRLLLLFLVLLVADGAALRLPVSDVGHLRRHRRLRISGACIYRSVLVVAGVVVGEESPHVYARSDAAALLRVHDLVNSSVDWFTYERAATTGAKIWNAFVGLV